MRLFTKTLAIVLLFAFMTAFAMQAPSDDRIHDQVIMKLASDRDVKGNTFQVDVKDGVVTVSGEVSKEQFREKAEKLIKKVKGVKGVVNNLKVKVG